MKKYLMGLGGFVLLAGMHTTAQAAISCSGLTVSSVSGVTPVTGNLDFTGSIRFTCTRLLTDPTSQTIYIGMNIGENPDGSVATGTDREMTRQTGIQQVNYSLFRNATFQGPWTSGTGRALTSTATGGLQTAVTFSSATTTSQLFSFPYYVRITQASWGAAGAPAGIYDDLGLIATLRLTNSTGSIQSTAGFGITMSKPSHCYFSSPPNNLTMNYTAFSSAAVTGSAAFGVSCTQGTSYTMALSATSGVLVGLNYTLSLSGAASQLGTGFQQNFTVNGNIAAGQAGTCASGSCTGTQARTLTITY